MKSINDTLIEIKNNLTQIKTAQSMQNDSSTIYVYRSENLFISSGSSKIYRVEYEPFDKSTTTLCQINFHGSSSMIIGSQDPDNPLVGYCGVFPNTSGASLDIFVWVYSNKIGVLKLSEV